MVDALGGIEYGWRTEGFSIDWWGIVRLLRKLRLGEDGG